MKSAAATTIIGHDEEARDSGARGDDRRRRRITLQKKGRLATRVGIARETASRHSFSFHRRGMGRTIRGFRIGHRWRSLFPRARVRVCTREWTSAFEGRREQSTRGGCDRADKGPAAAAFLPMMHHGIARGGGDLFFDLERDARCARTNWTEADERFAERETRRSRRR